MKKDWNDPLYVIKRTIDYFDGKDALADWPETKPEIEKLIKEEQVKEEQLRWTMGDL